MNLFAIGFVCSISMALFLYLFYWIYTEDKKEQLQYQNTKITEQEWLKTHM